MNLIGLSVKLVHGFFVILRGEKHDISLKILHQVGFETAWQAVTLAKLRALAIAPHPSLYIFEQVIGDKWWPEKLQKGRMEQALPTFF